MKSPNVSIITPTKNQGNYLEKCILSVLSQDSNIIEYIIIDGSSTDTTIEILKKYEHEISYWISEPDKGQSDALNKGLKKCTGDIIGWINSDDYYEPNALSHVAQIFNENQNINVVYGNCRMIYPNSTCVVKPLKVNYLSLLQYWRPYFLPPQPSIFFRRIALGDFWFNENLHYGMDLQLWLHLAKENKFHYVDRILSNYLVHEESKTGGIGNWNKFYAEWKVLCEDEIRALSGVDRLNLKFRKYMYLLKRKIKK